MAEGTQRLHRELVDSIPVLVGVPDPAVDRHQLAIWLPYFTGTKEDMAPFLDRLLEAGFAAVSLDPWQHGERSVESPEQLSERVFAHFRQEMWPIIGQTTLDAIHVIDWATSRLGVQADAVVAGGVSMGGDVSVALAGADPRVTRVAAIVATPDWARPGMAAMDDPSSVVDQGEPSGYGQWLYESLDPFRNQARFARGPAICFELGGADTHVPPTSALAFATALRASAPQAAARMRVVVHEGLDHLGAARDERVEQEALDWLTDRQD